MRGWRDGLIALAIVAGVLVLQLPFRLCAVSLVDEGAILQIAADVAQGHRLYTEAVHYAFPGVFYLTAAAFAVAGTSIETARMLAILLFALASGVVYLIARWSCGRRGALAVVTLFLVYRVWAYPHWQVLSYSTLALTLSLAATWIVGVKAMHLTTEDLRWRTRLGWARGLGVGLALGLLPAAVAMTLGVFTAGAGWSHDGGSLQDWVIQVAKTVLILAPAALAEELMFRGLPLVVTARVLGRSGAILLLSLLFALAHIRNPEVMVAGLGNIALAGIFLSLAFYSPGGMWTAFGAHLGWNATLAALAAPVSGLPFDIPYIDYRTGSPVWLTGGAFGPEGGLLATLALTATVVLVAQWIRREPT